MLVNEIFKSIQAEGMTLGKPSVFVRFFGCNLKCSWCIEQDTLITLSNGYQKMAKNINIGDELITPNGNTTVKEIYIRKVSKICKIKLKNGVELKCTVDHPLINSNGAIVEAQNLKSGDKLMYAG